MNDDTEPHVIDAEWEPVAGSREPPFPRRRQKTFGEKIQADGERIEAAAHQAFDEIDSFQSAVKDLWRRGAGVFQRFAKDVKVGDRKPMGR